MIAKEFNELRDSIFNSCKELTEKKGKDYTKGDIDVLKNFKEGSECFGFRSEQVLAIFLKKHIDAIYNYIKTNGQSQSEPIEERIKDAINYLVFLQALIKDKNITDTGIPFQKKL